MSTAEGKRDEVLSPIVRMLVGGGFIVEDALMDERYTLIVAYRYDEFGVAQQYCFAFAEGHLGEAELGAIGIVAEHHKSQLVLIGQKDAQLPSVDRQEFVNLFGGPIPSSLPLEPTFSDDLIQLGHNQLPDHLKGKADDLFEMYVRSALEFVFGSRVVRYGQDRRFEARADGIALPSREFSALYDTKAYSEGYKIRADSIRQFSSYVNDFFHRYQSYVPALNSFLVISGHFQQGEPALAEHSRDLLDSCHVPLCCITAASLAEIVELVSANPQFRRSIRWSRVFTDPLVKPQKVKREIGDIKKDQIIPRC